MRNLAAHFKGQLLRFSWQSGHFRYQSSAVQIRPLAKLYAEHVLNVGRWKGKYKAGNGHFLNNKILNKIFFRKLFWLLSFLFHFLSFIDHTSKFCFFEMSWKFFLSLPDRLFIETIWSPWCVVLVVIVIRLIHPQIQNGRYQGWASSPTHSSSHTRSLSQQRAFSQIWSHCIEPISGLWAVWPDLAKFRHLGKNLKAFGHFLSSYLVFCNIVNLLWQIFYSLGQFFIVVYGQILKNNRAIWSHLLRETR